MILENSTQYALFRLLPSWQRDLNNSAYIDTVLSAQCSVIFQNDCIPHNLLIAKLEVYCLDKTNFNLLIDYLGNPNKEHKYALVSVTSGT